MKQQRQKRNFTERILPLFTDTALALTALLVALIFLFVLIDAATAEEPQPTTMYVVGVTSLLNGRAKPSMDSNVEARFPLGRDVAVYEVSGQWAKVAGGESGYVWCYMFVLFAFSVLLWYQGITNTEPAP